MGNVLVDRPADDRTAHFREYRPLSAIALVLSYPRRGSSDEATTLIQRTHYGETLHTLLRNGSVFSRNELAPIERRVFPMANVIVIAMAYERSVLRSVVNLTTISHSQS